MSATAAALVLPSAPAVQHAAALAARRHRQRKHRGEAIRHKRTVAELQALEAKPLHERTEEEKEAVRGFRKRRNGRAAPALEPRALTSPSSAAPAVPVLSAASPVSASSLAASTASAGAPVVVAAAAAASSPAAASATAAAAAPHSGALQSQEPQPPSSPPLSAAAVAVTLAHLPETATAVLGAAHTSALPVAGLYSAASVATAAAAIEASGDASACATVCVDSRRPRHVARSAALRCSSCSAVERASPYSSPALCRTPIKG